MKILSKILLSITSFFILFLFSFNISLAYCTDFFCLWDNPQEIQYCKGDSCSLSGGIEQVKGQVTGIEKDRTFIQYIQAVIGYLIGFIFFIALVYVLYAGFNILVSSGEEEKVKKSKSIISYVIIGIIIMFSAYSIVNFVMKDVLTAGVEESGPGPSS